jgi:FAD/FMN-containing dehydrogenase
MPFDVLQSAFDGLYPAGLQWSWRTDFFNEISDAAIDVHLKYGAQLPTGHSTMHQELHPTSAGGAYINFMMNEGQDRIKASYRGNYQRLTQLKHRYDPDNVFHINQNILPASGPGPQPQENPT